MKTILVLALAFSAANLSAAALAAGNQSGQTKRLGTNFDFEDQLIRGKYEYPDEAVATVEDEKMLNDLLPVRKEFKDRLQEMSMER